MPEITVRPGQIWGDNTDLRELVVEHIDEKYAYCRDLNHSRQSRIQIRRMKRSKQYYLRAESPARYVEVPSEENICICKHEWEKHGYDGCFLVCPCKEFKAAKTYWVWTGDAISPTHCPCEDFRWHKREPGEIYHCKHLKLVLGSGGMK